MNVGRSFSVDFFSSSSLDAFEVLAVDYYSELAAEILFVFRSATIVGTTIFTSLSTVSLIVLESTSCGLVNSLSGCWVIAS